MVLGPMRRPLRNAQRGSQVKGRSPACPAPPRRTAPPPPTLLEDLQGDGAVLDSHYHAAVVQVEDVVLLLEHLRETGDGTLRRVAGCSGSGLLAGSRTVHTQAGGVSRGQGWCEAPACPGHPHAGPQHPGSAHAGWAEDECF